MFFRHLVIDIGSQLQGSAIRDIIDGIKGIDKISLEVEFVFQEWFTDIAIESIPAAIAECQRCVLVIQPRLNTQLA